MMRDGKAQQQRRRRRRLQRLSKCRYVAFALLISILSGWLQHEHQQDLFLLIQEKSSSNPAAPSSSSSTESQQEQEQQKLIQQSSPDDPLVVIPNQPSPSEMLEELVELVGYYNYSRYDCKKQHGGGGLLAARDRILPVSITHPGNRNIPRIVHITSKSRCLTPAFYQNVEMWKLRNYSLFFHDDQAIHRLLTLKADKLPNLHLIRKCMKPQGASLTDLWRLVLLYEYGGIYTDIDNVPGPDLLDPIQLEKTIAAHHDGILIGSKERGSISQHFLGFAPQHPLMYYGILETWLNLFRIKDVEGQFIPSSTGPGVLKKGWDRFLMHQPGPKLAHVGVHRGVDNRTVEVLVRIKHSARIVHRNGLSDAAKREYYKAAGIQDYERNYDRARVEFKKQQQEGDDNNHHHSCFEMLWEKRHQTIEEVHKEMYQRKQQEQLDGYMGYHDIGQAQDMIGNGPNDP